MKKVKILILVVSLIAVFFGVHLFLCKPTPSYHTSTPGTPYDSHGRTLAVHVPSEVKIHQKKVLIPNVPIDSMRLRHDAIAEFCARHPELSNDHVGGQVYQHLLFESKYKLLYCFVPKAGCTSLKPVIETLRGAIQPNTTGRKQIHGKVSKGVSMLIASQKEREEVLRTHFKFMILRDPAERMLSAYKDKLEVPMSEDKRLNDTLRKKMFRRYDQLFHSSVEVVTVNQRDHDVRTMPFEDYLKFLSHSSVERLDHHFVPMSHLCNPCAVNYNYYGKLPTLTDDVHHVLDEVGAPLWLYQDRIEHSFSVRDFMELYFGEMSAGQRAKFKQNLTEETGYTFEAAPDKDVDRQLLKDAFKKYSADFDLYYALFPNEERTYERYVGKMDFLHTHS